MVRDKTHVDKKTLSGEVDYQYYHPIVTALEHTIPGSFFFVEINSPVERKKFPAKVKHYGYTKPLTYLDVTAHLPPDLPFYVSITEWLQDKGDKEESEVHRLVLDGFPELFKNRDKAKQWLQSFNFSREGLSRLPVLYIFLMPTFCLDLVRHYATDLWGWRAFLFTIPTSESRTEIKQPLDSSTTTDFEISPHDNPEKREARIRILTKMLDKDLEEHGDIGAVWNSILYPLAQELRVAGRHKDSIKTLDRARTWIKSSPDSETTSNFYTLLNNNHYDLGNLNQAQEYFEQSLKIDERLLGFDHPKMAVDMNNIALVCKEKGELDAALLYFKRALEIDEQIFGSLHPNVASDLNNIALVFLDKNEMDTALVYLERALEIDEKAFGNIHPNVARDLNNIASVLTDKGEMDSAIEYLHRALDIDEQVFGSEHPNVARDVNNIATVLKDKDETAEAREYLKRAYRIFCNTYGRDNPSTRTAYNNYLSCDGDPDDLE